MLYFYSTPIIKETRAKIVTQIPGIFRINYIEKHETHQHQARIGPSVNREFTESNLPKKKEKIEKKKKKKETRIYSPKGPLIYALNLSEKGLQIFMHRI